MFSTSQPHVTDENSKLTPYFRQFLVQLLNLFHTNRHLLETRGSFIIRYKIFIIVTAVDDTFFYRQLCVLLDAHQVYITIAGILLEEEKFEFASLMVQSLNIILFTAKELLDLRLELRDLATNVRGL